MDLNEMLDESARRMEETNITLSEIAGRRSHYADMSDSSLRSLTKTYKQRLRNQKRYFNKLLARRG